MRKLALVFAVILVCLLAPIVPFVVWGRHLEASLPRALETLEAPGPVAAFAFCLLASDIFLPIPSSVVATVAGAKLGVIGGALVCAAGLTVGAIAGFALARLLGRPLVSRLASQADLAGLEAAADRYGVVLLVVTRPLPVLAEATVLLLGTVRMDWRVFLLTVALSNFGIAVCYAVLGKLAHAHHQLLWAVIASAALPLVAAAAGRRVLFPAPKSDRPT